MEHLTELILGTATGIFGIATWVIIVGNLTVSIHQSIIGFLEIAN